MRREPTIHRANKFGNRTVCGLSIFKSAKHLKTQKTYKGVDCVNCLKVRAKKIRLDQAAKDARYQKRVSKRGTKVMASNDHARKAGYS